MIPYKPIHTISIGSVTIFVWGLFFALAFIFGIYIAVYFAKKRNLSAEHAYNLSFAILLGAIIGGRLGYVFAYLDRFHSFLDIFKVWEGGMTFHGGLIGGILFCWVYMNWKKISYWVYFDVFAPSVALGYAITRIGCLLIGDHLGMITQVPWAIYYGGAPRHPVAFYHMSAALLIFVLLVYVEKTKKIGKLHYFPGLSFSLLIGFYGFTRFFVEFFREESRYYGFDLAQYISILMVFIGLFMFHVSRRKHVKQHTKQKF
ncbi:MAG: prolipoprotein diacylglyceryl transferase [Nanoarchaeota archaeon]|nr:prolipoprotein diacylglyceryl transferase [Nanoarchaeota archaeon]